MKILHVFGACQNLNKKFSRGEDMALAGVFTRVLVYRKNCALLCQRLKVETV